jgi:hypothetical protein
MAAQRTVALRVEKAELIARLELQRANMAETWREISEPIETFDKSIGAFSRHSKTFGGIAAAAGFALLFTGKLHLFRRVFKLALWAVPYIFRYRSSGVIGTGFSLLKKAVRKML